MASGQADSEAEFRASIAKLDSVQNLGRHLEIFLDLQASLLWLYQLASFVKHGLNLSTLIISAITLNFRRHRFEFVPCLLMKLKLLWWVLKFSHGTDARS